MKLNFGRRLVLFVHWLMSLALCALGVALFVWSECRATVAALLNQPDVFIYAIAVLVVYLLFAAGSVAIICGGRGKKRRDSDFIVVDSGQAGRTRIAVSAVEQMIRQAVRNISGISEMKASIVNGSDSIDINTDVVILNRVHVPTVTACIQRAIRGYIEQNCGVTVRRVSVSIHSVAEEEQARGRKSRKKKTEVGNVSEQTSVGNDAYVTPEQAMGPVPDVPVFEPEAVLPEESAPVEFAPESEPAEEEPAIEEAPEEELAAEPEAAAEEPVVEEAALSEEAAPAAEGEPEAPAPKRGFFKRLFGKREKAAPEEAATGEPAPADETEPTAEEGAPAAEDADDESVTVYPWTDAAEAPETGDADAEEAPEAEPEDDIASAEETDAEPDDGEEDAESDADADDAADDSAEKRDEEF